MAQPIVENNNSFDQWRLKTNQISISVGDIASLTTPVTTNLVQAVNSIQALIDSLGISSLGNMADQNADAVTITGGNIVNITDITIADGGTGASTAPNARTNLDVYSKAETENIAFEQVLIFG